MSTLACRLIHASNLAYSIPQTGASFDAATITAAVANVGFLPATLQFFRAPGQNQINACYYGETATEAILSFRGTLPPTNASLDGFFRSLLDWINDGDIKLVKGSNLAGMVHSGFLKSLDELWGWIDGLQLKKVVDGGKALRITGHSKGGALVYLAAYRLAQLGVKVASAYSYAGARAGDDAFAKAYDQMVKNGNIQEALRFEYQNDLVPHLPPSTSSWRVIQQGLTLIHNKFPLAAPHATANPAMVRDVDNFLTQFDHISNWPSYVSAGKLQFIDWDNNIVGDSFSLSTDRNLRLATKMAEFKFEEIAADHSSTGGYMQIPCKV